MGGFRLAACLFGRLLPLPLALFPAPYPPPPFPGGEGGDYYFISPGATAPGTPASEPGRHGAGERATRPAGGAGFSGRRIDLAAVVSKGGLPVRLPAYPAFSLRSFPHSPRPPSPAGKGEIFSFLMQGASPLASPRLSRKRHGLNLRCRNPAGGLPVRSPAAPAFSFVSCPLTPRPPSPAGKGETKVISCKGLRPLHPCF